MKKRFVDCDIWEDDWFLGLPCLYKEFWRYICDRCDPAGVWKPSYKLAGALIGEPISDKHALELFNNGKERVAVLYDGNWWITGFIPFQYHSGLSKSCNAHKPIYAFSSKYGVDITKWETEGLVKGSLTLPEGFPNPTRRVQDKDMDRDKDSSLTYNSEFVEFWKAYPRKTGKIDAYNSWKKRNPPIAKCLSTLEWQIKSDQWVKEGGQYIPLPTTWINQGRWEDVPPTHKIVFCSVCGAEGILPKSVSSQPMCRKCADKANALPQAENAT